MQLNPSFCRDAGVETEADHVIATQRLEAGVWYKLLASLPVLGEQAGRARKKPGVMQLAGAVIPSGLDSYWLQFQLVVVRGQPRTEAGRGCLLIHPLQSSIR